MKFTVKAKNKIKSRVIFITSILACSAILVSCGSDDSATNKETTAANQLVEETTGNENSEIYPITIKHAFGETVINEKPERIATIAWGNQDIPLALGVSPIGIAKSNFGELDENGLAPWTAEAIVEQGFEMPVIFDETDGIDFEALNDTNPDVILAAYSGITQEDYDLLNEIAPVIAYPENAWQTYWREQILLNSKGMGMEKEGVALVEYLEALLAGKTSAYPEIEGKTAMFTWFNPTDLGNFYVYLPTDPRANYLTDLGFEFPTSVYDLAEDTSSFAIQISAEQVASLSDVDVIVSYGDAEFLETLQNDPLLSTVPAIQRGSVVLLENNSDVAGAATPSALSIPYTIDKYLAMFGEAISKING